MPTLKQLQDRNDVLVNEKQILEKHIKEKQIVIDILKEELKEHRKFSESVQDLVSVLRFKTG